MLLCDLRVLFSDEEWRDLDANLGDDWKAIQVQYLSDLILTKWGVYAYKQETNMDDIQFTRPICNSFSYMPSSCLVPKGSPEQKMKHFLESYNPRGYLNEPLPLLESEIGKIGCLKVFFQTWRNAKAEVIVETYFSAYGVSLKQDHEDSADDEVINLTEVIIESIPKVIAESFPENLSIFRGVCERYYRAGLELMKKKKLDIKLQIVLEYNDRRGSTIRRFWVITEIKLGHPFYKPVLKRIYQLDWEHVASNEPLGESDFILELKCQHPVNEETSRSSFEESWYEGNYNLELEELLRTIEQDVMSLNKSYGKMKASIVRTSASISTNFLSEARILKRAIVTGGWRMSA